ncbi:MAG: peptide/nickel transport system permease protein [Acidimicrobiaceae bacterium]
MLRTLTRRLLQVVVVLVLVTFGTACLTSFVRGDTAEVVAPFASDQQRAQIRKDLHLDEPIINRYGLWLNDFVHGDLGKVYTGPQTTVDVSQKVGDALPISLRLMVFSQILALLIAIPLGVATAYKVGSLFDRTTSSVAFGLLAIPSFVAVLLLEYYLGVKLRLYPATYDPKLTGFDGTFRNYFIPTVALALGQIAVYLRLLRSDMIATLQEDYITMAKAKGMSPSRVLWRHALRPSSLVLLTVAGLNVGTLIGGALLVEFLYAMPGMGVEIQKAIIGKQYVALQSYVAIIAVGYIAVNVFVDIFYSVLDPRIRHGRSTG